MDVTIWLAELPVWLSATLVAGVPTALAILLGLAVRRVVTLEKLTSNNEVAGFKFAVLGVLYAVLLGFVVVVVWEKFRDAETAVVQEAGSTASLYRLSEGLTPQGGAAFRRQLGVYLGEAVAHDWPAMARGAASPGGTRAISELYRALMADTSEDRRANALYSEMLTQLDNLTQERRTRLVLAAGVVPGVIWMVLLGGAAATIGFTFFFGTHNVGAQMLMTGLLAIVVFMGLLVIVAVNHPFTGPVSVSFEPLQEVLEEFGGNS